MAGGIGKRIILLLDWCWPFPLGIVATALALVMSTGIWLALRDPQTPLAGRELGQAASTEILGHVPSILPSPTQYPAPAAPNPTAVQTLTSRPSAAKEASPAATLIGPKPGGRVAVSERMGALAESSTSREISPPTKVAATAVLAKPQVAQPKVQPRPVAPQLSATQQAEITDRLTIGRFLMDRKEYSAAIKEFQAALAIDPSSREAHAAIQKAREASKQLESVPMP